MNKNNPRTKPQAARVRKALRQLRALKAASGSWKSVDHPELSKGSVRWVKTLRD